MASETENGDVESNHYAVFIDTSLDTHLVTMVSDSDTVADLKKKIMLHHRQCFPTIGDIKIHGLKIEKNEKFYHISDCMLVKKAFLTNETEWFVSVDASHEDQLALPWVTDSRSIDRHDNHGSQSTPLKKVPFVSQKVPSIDQLTSGDSCKDVAKKLEEDNLYNDNRLNSKVLEKIRTEYNDVKSKKRTHDVVHVDNESILEGEGNAKASEEDKVSTFDTDEGTKNDNSFEHKSEGKDLSDESTRIYQGENGNALDQLSIVVPSQYVGEESNSRKDVETTESVPDVAVVAEQNIHQEVPLEISLKEKGNEMVQKTLIGNELPSSSMRTSDHERDAAEIASMGKPKPSKSSTKRKAAEKESSSTSFIKKLDNISKDVIDSSQQDIGSTVQNSTGDQTDKEKQGPEVKLPERKKRAKKSAAKNNDKSLVKRADNPVGDNDISSTVPAPVSDVRNEFSEKTSMDDSKIGNEMIVNQVEIIKPTEICKSQMVEENVEEMSRAELKDNVRSKKKKKDAEKYASRIDESVVKHTNDTTTVTNEEIVLPRSERKENLQITSTHAENSRSENNISQVIAESVVDDPKKNRYIVRSRKKKKSASRNDDSVIKHMSDTATVTNEEISLSQSESPDIALTDAEISRNNKSVSQVNSEGINGNSEKQNDMIDVTKKTKKKTKTRKSASRNDESMIKHMSDAATVANEETVLSQSERKESSEMALTDAEISRNNKNVSEAIGEGINGNSEKQNDSMDSIKKSKRKRKTEKSASRNENKSITKHANSDTCENVEQFKSSLLPDTDKKDDVKVKEKDAEIIDKRVVKRAKKNRKPLVTITPPQDLPSGRQSAELELESDKSQAVDHDHLPGEASKTVTVSEVSKVNNEADISKGRQSAESKKNQTVDHEHFPEDASKNLTVSHDSKVNNEAEISKGRQSGELELELKKIQTVDHDHLPEEASKNVTVSEVSKVNNEADISKDESHKIDSLSKKMSMSDGLRRSSRFKKAKLTVSQKEDTERAS